MCFIEDYEEEQEETFLEKAHNNTTRTFEAIKRASKHLLCHVFDVKILGHAQEEKKGSREISGSQATAFRCENRDYSKVAIGNTTWPLWNRHTLRGGSVSPRRGQSSEATKYGKPAGMQHPVPSTHEYISALPYIFITYILQ